MSKTILTLTDVERELNELKSKRGRKSKETLERIEYLKGIAQGLIQPKKEIKLSSSMMIKLVNSNPNKITNEWGFTSLTAIKWREIIIRESNINTNEKLFLLDKILLAINIIQCKEFTKEQIVKVAKALEELKPNIAIDFYKRIRRTLKTYWNLCKY